MLRLYASATDIPQYANGSWRWNLERDIIEFNKCSSAKRLTMVDAALEAPRLQFGIKFADYIDEVGENVFRDSFRRPDWCRDADVITIQDVKEVALFTAPAGAFSARLIEFVHCDTVDQFFNDLIIYFEYFLKLVEFLLIRRDEQLTKQLDMRSVRIEQMMSAYLVQYRLVLAREYSKIVMGWRDMAPFHHLANKSKVSKTGKDSDFFDSFLCLCTRLVWIAMHRKSYVVIDFEINRLMRTEHFNVAQKQLPNCPKYTKREQLILYGPNNTLCNFRNQRSPLILELLNITPKNSDVLWLNETKYRGTNPRMYDLEKEYATAEAQLFLCDVHHGILGNPKALYNTMLVMDGYALRQKNYTESYDPYHLARQPKIQIPNYEEFKKSHENSEPIFRFVNKKYEEDVINRQKRLWKNRERIIERTDVQSKTNRNIVQRCRREMDAIGKPVLIDRDGIIDRFIQDRDRKMKKTEKAE